MISPALQALYDRIPKVEGCMRGCSDCCGPVPMSADEAEAIPHIVRPDRIEDGFLTPTNPLCRSCLYSTPKGCSIYDHRPLMCRLFAAVADEPMLECPHGARANHPLTKDEALGISRQYVAICATIRRATPSRALTRRSPASLSKGRANDDDG